jgi:hypothetical protein
LTIFVHGDATATVNNILASESLFRIGFVSNLMGQAVFILLVLALYRLLAPVNKNQAVLMTVFALVGIPIAMLSMVNQAAAMLLLSGADYLTAFELNQLHALVMLFLELQGHSINIAQIFWGLWLLPFGYLVFKSGFIPAILGILLVIGGFGYLIDFFIKILLPDYGLTISQFTFVGELLFPLWLLIRGVNVERWKNAHRQTPAAIYAAL